MNTVDKVMAEVGRGAWDARAAKRKKAKIGAGATFAEKEYLLERDGVGFSPRGNVMALTAEKKAGKSWFAMAMCDALLAGRFLGMTSRSETAKVIYFDTEQDEGDGQRILRRVHSVCGWDFATDMERFEIYHLREMESKERREFVVETIEDMRPDFVILDGIRDLLDDFNDIAQSAELVGVMMRLSSKMNCAIWCVLHVNPNSDKMRGHLGTELGNKVADILHMTKKKSTSDEDIVTYKMEEVAARSHKDIRSITFRIDDSRPYGLPELVNESEAKEMAECERKFLTEKMRGLIHSPESVSYTELRTRIKSTERIGSAAAGRMLASAIALGIIGRQQNGKYIFTASSAKAVSEELPFEQSNENAPF